MQIELGVLGLNSKKEQNKKNQKYCASDAPSLDCS